MILLLQPCKGKVIMKYDINPGVRGLIFDLDGTLADTMPLHFKCWLEACRKFGAEIDNNFLRKHSGSPGPVIAREVIREYKLNGNVSIDDIIEVKLQLFSLEQHLLKPIDPVVAIVKKYYGILPMAVGTGGHREAVDQTLETTGLTEYFKVVVTANDVTNFKPHPETFLKCAEQMGIEPKYVQVFEDGDIGLQAARTAGMIATDVRSWYDSAW
jgi:beta-phosphoglucomutase-like phosphatase (HAD superfamily)